MRSGGGYTFFIDRCLGKRDVAQALKDSGAQVEVHDAHFSTEAPDVQWIQGVGQRGWLILTSDRIIRYKAHELQTVGRAAVGMFVLKSKNLTGVEMGRVFVRALSRMISFADRTDRPFIAKVSRDGRVEPWWPARSR